MKKRATRRPPFLHPVKVAAPLFSMSAYTFYKKCREGKLPCYRIGRTVLINIDEVATVMKMQGSDAARR